MLFFHGPRLPPIQKVRFVEMCSVDGDPRAPLAHVTHQHPLSFNDHSTASFKIKVWLSIGKENAFFPPCTLECKHRKRPKTDKRKAVNRRNHKRQFVLSTVEKVGRSKSNLLLHDWLIGFLLTPSAGIRHVASPWQPASVL